MNEWININDNTPSSAGSYLVYTEDDRVTILKWYEEFHSFAHRTKVLYWQFLPLAPNREQIKEDTQKESTKHKRPSIWKRTEIEIPKEGIKVLMTMKDGSLKVGDFDPECFAWAIAPEPYKIPFCDKLTGEQYEKIKKIIEGTEEAPADPEGDSKPNQDNEGTVPDDEEAPDPSQDDKEEGDLNG